MISSLFKSQDVGYIGLVKILSSWLTDQPLIPVSAVSIIIGMILWLTSIHMTAEDASANVGELKDLIRYDIKRRDEQMFLIMQENYRELNSINSRLTKIESKLD